VFRACSVLTHMRSFSWSYHCELHSIMTQSICVHTHWMAVMHTQWVFRGCSHSLIGIHVHSMGCSAQLEMLSAFWWHVILTRAEGPMNMFSNLRSAQRPNKFVLNFWWMPFCGLCQGRRHDIILEYMIHIVSGRQTVTWEKSWFWVLNTWLPCAILQNFAFYIRYFFK
jgi:hypothetical protein